MIKLSRKEAIKIVQYFHLLHLTIEEKGNLLYGYNRKIFDEKTHSWNIVEISKQVNNKRILKAYDFDGLVTNYYVEKLILSLMSVEVIILDQYVTSGVACECCGYIVTIEKRMFDICLVCQWEFTNTSEDEYSGPNHTTLASYRNRYESRRANNKFDLIYVKFRSSNKSLKNDEVI